MDIFVEYLLKSLPERIKKEKKNNDPDLDYVRRIGKPIQGKVVYRRLLSPQAVQEGVRKLVPP